MFEIPEDLPSWFNRKIEVKKSDIHGLGVFATEKIEKHEVIERAPTLVFSPGMFKVLRMSEEFQGRDHIINSYCFNWSPGECAIVWGYGSIYNHANGTGSNASYRMHLDIPCVEFYAKQDIEPGQEVMIHYVRGRCDIDFCDDGSWMQADVNLIEALGHRPTGLDGDWRNMTAKTVKTPHKD